MNKFVQKLAIFAFIVIGTGRCAQSALGQAPEAAPAGEEKVAAVAPKVVAEIFETMMGAIEDNNRAAFLVHADTRFKAALTPPQFQSLVDQVGPRLKSGHKFLYLGEMNQAGFVTHLWRVRFDDGGDDNLAQMSVKEEKVGGFFLR